MSGVALRSGRRRRRTAEKDGIELVMLKSMRWVLDCLEDPDIEKSQKFDVASRFVMRHMPEKVDIKQDVRVISVSLSERLIQLLSQKNNMQINHNTIQMSDNPKLPMIEYEANSNDINDLDK